VKLLFDASVSPNILDGLDGLFPGSSHVSLVGLPDETQDADVWKFARKNRFSIVTTGKGFLLFSLRYGAPPKVIRLNLNPSCAESGAMMIRLYAVEVTGFLKSSRPVLILLNT
jgi:predicted nuclease of predicted toxin-antitoxin system